jgi:hypothetical protein
VGVVVSLILLAIAAAAAVTALAVLPTTTLALAIALAATILSLSLSYPYQTIPYRHLARSLSPGGHGGDLRVAGGQARGRPRQAQRGPLARQHPRPRPRPRPRPLARPLTPLPGAGGRVGEQGHEGQDCPQRRVRAPGEGGAGTGAGAGVGAGAGAGAGAGVGYADTQAADVAADVGRQPPQPAHPSLICPCVRVRVCVCPGVCPRPRPRPRPRPCLASGVGAEEADPVQEDCAQHAEDLQAEPLPPRPAPPTPPGPGPSPSQVLSEMLGESVVM